MSEAPEPWLPPSAVEGEVERAVAAFLSPWVKDWLSRGDAVRVGGHSAPVGEDLCWFGSTGAAVGITPATRTKFGMALVDGQADPDNPADRELLDRLIDAALADLAGRLGSKGEALGVCASDIRSILRFSPENERWHLLLSLDSRARIAIRKAAAGHHPAPALASLRDAVAPERVAIGCHIGRAALSAGEVAGLAPGDLITFDRRLADDLPLTVAGRIDAGGKAKIVDEGLGPAVRIIQAAELQCS